MARGLSIALLLSIAIALMLPLASGESSAAPRMVRVLVLKATWGPRPFSDAEVSAVVFDEAARFIDTASFGQVQITGAQTPWLQAYSGVPACAPGPLTEPAKTAAASAGYDVAAYDRVIYLLPTMPNGCPTDTADIRTGTVALIGNLVSGLVEHELGHTFGLSHAGAANYGRSGRLRFDHYGDYWDVMGSGYLGNIDMPGNGAGDGDYGALQKACGGWLTSYTHLERSDVYTLDALELPSTKPQALVVDTATREYWIDHREPVGNDAYLSSAADFYRQVTTGIEVHETQRNAVAVSELKRQPDYLLPNGRHGALVTPVGSTFQLAGVFALDVIAHDGTTMTVRFRWTDHTKPTRPRITSPSRGLRHGRPLLVAWHASHDSGSGVKEYRVKLDAGSATTVSAAGTGKILRLQLGVPSRGHHRVTVTAVDYAGNQSKVSAREFLVR